MQRNLSSQASRPYTSRNLFDLIIFAVFFVLGGILMYIGYFNEYSELRFTAYLLGIILLGVFYVVYFGLIAAPQRAIYNWMIMLMLFPKKELRPDMESLLNIGLGFTNVGLSMYQILDIFIVLAIILSILTRKPSLRQERMPLNVRFFYRAYFIMAIIGLLHVVIAWYYIDILDSFGYDRMFIGLWPLLSGLIVFKASFYFINSEDHIKKIFTIPLASSTILLAEFLLAKYTSILPQSVVYYSLNYRGAFRSALQSGDLFVSLILITGAASSFFFYYTSRKKFYLVLAAAFAFVIMQTYNRGSFLGVLIMAAVVFTGMSRQNKWIVYGLSGTALILITAPFFSGLFQEQGIFKTLSDILNVGDVKKEGYFDFSSTFDRMGATVRGLDVFLYAPVFGSGPGNITLFMSSPSVPGNLGWIISNPISLGFYQLIVSGMHSTDPHNLYVRLTAEYGLAGMVVVLATFYVPFINFRAFKREYRENPHDKVHGLYIARLCSSSIITAFGVYFMFQAGPLLFGMFFIMLRLTIFNKNVLNQPYDMTGRIFPSK